MLSGWSRRLFYLASSTETATLNKKWKIKGVGLVVQVFLVSKCIFGCQHAHIWDFQSVS